jgi:RNA polymerase sigma-70 factor, ECF subfamily
MSPVGSRGSLEQWNGTQPTPSSVLSSGEPLCEANMTKIQVESHSPPRVLRSVSAADSRPGAADMRARRGEDVPRHQKEEIDAGRKPHEARRGDAELVERVKRGDEAAFEALLERHQEKVYRLAWNFTRHAQDAEEVTQDVFLTVYRKIGNFDGRAAFGTWLYRVATNRALMKLRARRGAHVFQIEEAGPTFRLDGRHARPVADWSALPEDELLSGERRRVLTEAIEALPPDYKAAVVLRDIEGLSTHEAAEVLGVSVAAVKSRLHRARLALRERLAAYFEADARGRRAYAPPLRFQ